MACGCIPIGSVVGAIPEIIGNTGFILKAKRFEELNELLENKSGFDLEVLQKRASEKIRNNFSFSRRKKKLLQVLN